MKKVDGNHRMTIRPGTLLFPLFEKVADNEVRGTEYGKRQGVSGVRMRIVRLKLGDDFLEMTEYLAPKGNPIPTDARSNDRAFLHIAISVSDTDKAYPWLRRHKVTHASTGPPRLLNRNKSTGGIHAFYFRAPAATRWKSCHSRLTKAPPVAPTRRRASRLTLSLNNVFGTRHASRLCVGAGPGIKFMEYLAPGDARARPSDLHANDLAHWQTKLVTREVAAVERAVRRQHYPLVSPDVIALPNGEANLARNLLERAPDGHVRQLIER